MTDIRTEIADWVFDNAGCMSEETLADRIRNWPLPPVALPDGWRATRMALGSDARVYERGEDGSEVVVWARGGVALHEEDSPITITELAAVLAYHAHTHPTKETP